MTDLTAPSSIVAFARELGDPRSPFAILAEGNVSIRDGSGFVVKATGAQMCDASDDDFVRVELGTLLDLIHDVGRTADDDVSRAFGAAGEPGARRPSVESLLHAVCYRIGSVRAVAHSHPETALALLSSSRPELIAEGAMFPDQIVVLGRHPLYVPYADPGLELARNVDRLLDDHCATHGEPPKVLYLQNHGIFALGTSVAEAMRITRMAEKCARVLVGALAAGGPRFLVPTEADRIDTRPDELLRRRQLAEGLPARQSV